MITREDTEVTGPFAVKSSLHMVTAGLPCTPETSSTTMNAGVLQWQSGIHDLKIGDSASVIVISILINIYVRLQTIYSCTGRLKIMNTSKMAKLLLTSTIT